MHTAGAARHATHSLSVLAAGDPAVHRAAAAVLNASDPAPPGMTRGLG